MLNNSYYDNGKSEELKVQFYFASSNTQATVGTNYLITLTIKDGNVSVSGITDQSWTSSWASVTHYSRIYGFTVIE